MVCHRVHVQCIMCTSYTPHHGITHVLNGNAAMTRQHRLGLAILFLHIFCTFLEAAYRSTAALSVHFAFSGTVCTGSPRLHPHPTLLACIVYVHAWTGLWPGLYNTRSHTNLYVEQCAPGLSPLLASSSCGLLIANQSQIKYLLPP